MSTEESALLPGMTDKGRLGFAIQLKFMQLHGRFPERHDEIDPNATQRNGWLRNSAQRQKRCLRMR